MTFFNFKYQIANFILRYPFEFDNEKYSFKRTNKKNDVIECNPDYTEKKSLTLDEYKQFLLEKYKLENIELSFRSIVGPYSRIFHNGKNITPGRVLDSNAIQNESPIKIFEKLNNVYYKIKDKDEKVTAANSKKKVLKQARKLNVQLEETEIINVKEIKSELDELEQERSALINNQNEKIKLLNEEKVAKIIELKKKLSILQKRRQKLCARKSTISNNLDNNAMPSKASFDALLDFFPEANIKNLKEIEDFHSKLTSILEDEYKENLAEVDNVLKEIEPKIDSMEKELQELEKDAGSFKIAFLEKFSEIENKIKSLKEKLEKNEKNKQEAKELKELTSQLNSDEKVILEELSQKINTELSYFSKEIIEPNVSAVTIEFPTTKKYSVSIPHDDGTGSTYTSDLIFDLAVLKNTVLPFLIHDSYLYANIRGKRLDNIISKYNSFSNKQIFIAIDQIDTLQEQTKELINDRKVITLYADGGELFGESWNKNHYSEIQNM